MAVCIAMLMPAHLRAVDPQVLVQLGARGKSLVQAADETAGHNPAVAKILLAAAEELKLEGTGQVLDTLRGSASSRARNSTVLEQLEGEAAGRVQVAETPVYSALRARANRERLMAGLSSPEARRVLESRGLTNSIFFAPVRSAAGVPLDIAIVTTAFLMEQGAFPAALPLHDEVLRLVSGENVRGLDELYLSVFALARRFSSEQIVGLVSQIPTADALHQITRNMQENPRWNAALYAAVFLSKDGGGVAAYTEGHHSTAEEDLNFALKSGVPALEEVVERGEPIFRPGFYNALAQDSRLQFVFRPLLLFATGWPMLALIVKFVLICLGGFLLVFALKFRTRREETSFVFFPQFALVRRVSFAVIFRVLMILIGEPYLAQGEPKPAPEPRFDISMLLGAASPPAPASKLSKPMIDSHTLIAILTFLVLQTAIYVICLVKIAEIRKQNVSNGTKLKLLENEDNLFDGGLYCGLFGTAASLILLTLGAIKPSLVSAYSSTLFGILFVALLKIGHVRPYKRRLLLETANNSIA
jgi:hypothetical protein